MPVYNGVVNVTQGLDGFTVDPGHSDTTNTANLQYIVSQLLTSTGPTLGQGGTVQFPSAGTYKFSGAVTIGPDNEMPSQTQPYSVLFMGTGAGSGDAALLQITDGSNDLFIVDNNTGPDNDVGGILFQDLQIQYPTSETPGAAIRVNHSQNVRIERVIFQDCGIVYTNSLQGLIRACTFFFVNRDSGTAITINDGGSHHTSCNQIKVEKCDLRGSITPNTLTGILISACKHATVRTVSISSMNQGIVLAPTAVAQNDIEYTLIDDCQVVTESGSLILLATSGASALNDTRVTNSAFSQGNAGEYTNGGLYFQNAGSAPNSQIDTVRIMNCTSQGWLGPGIEIAVGQNIQIIGGTFSGNGLGSGAGIVKAGLGITGNAENISAVGADFSATYLGGSPQLFALAIPNSPTTVLFKNCVMLGYSGSVTTGVINVTGSPTRLQLIDSTGYNDTATALTTSSPAAATLFNGLNYSYYGPVAFYSSGGSGVLFNIDGHGTGLNSGGFTLGPGENAEIILAVGGTLPTKFIMIAK